MALGLPVVLGLVGRKMLPKFNERLNKQLQHEHFFPAITLKIANMLPPMATHHHPQWHEIHRHPSQIDRLQSFHRNGGFNDNTLKHKPII